MTLMLSMHTRAGHFFYFPVGSRSGNGHNAACFGTAAARFRTLLAMIMLVLSAFGCARFADPGAQGANFRRKLRSATQRLRCVGADFRTFTVQTDTFPQHFQFIFL
jgi:hypothetical protein